MNETDKSKPKKPSLVHIISLCKYGIYMDSNNYIVSLLPDSSQIEANPTDIKLRSISYHGSLQEALKNLSTRILKDKLSKTCKDKVLELDELVLLIADHVKWFEEQTYNN